MTNSADFTRQAAELVAENDRSPTAPRQADVDGLRELLDLVEDFPSNDQRARYILTSNWFRDHGESASAWASVTGVWLPEQRRASVPGGRMGA